MNDRQIAFIMCVNDERQADESEYYIRCLNVPESYGIDIIKVREAPSMAAGYNAAMQSSDSRYKVYLHQDTRIINPDFINCMLEVFERDETIGMLGCVGCLKLPVSGQAVGCWDIGTVYHNCIPGKLALAQNADRRPMEVEALDGLLLATAQDIGWREDLFDGWDFYDVSQCLEMKRAGYKIVVPFQERPWCYHDNFYSRMVHYQKYCKRMTEEYQDIKSFQATDYSQTRKELEQIKEIARRNIGALVNAGDKEGLMELFREPANRGWLHLKDYEVLADILDAERRVGAEPFWKPEDTDEILHVKLQELHWILKRIEYQKHCVNEEVYSLLQEYSVPAIKTVLCAYTEEPQEIWDRMQEKLWAGQKN